MKLQDIKNAVVVWGPLSSEGINYIKEKGEVVVVPEMRPSLLGLYHNARALEEAGVRFVCCSDSVLGLLFFKGKICKTLLFGKKTDGEGWLGSCGSDYVRLLSRIHGVGVEVMDEGSTAIVIKDKDASSLGGKKMVLGNEREWVIVQDTEVIDET